MRRTRPFIIAAPLLALMATLAEARRPDGELELSIVDAESGRPVAARLHLRDARGRAATPDRTPAPWGAAPLGDHAYIDGAATLGLARGAYRFDLDAGPEFRTQHGHFEIARHAQDDKRIEVTRFADLAKEGWAAADLATCRAAADHPLLQRAEQLAYAPTVAAEWRDGAWNPPKLAQRRRHDALSATALWSDPRGVVWLIDPDARRSIEDLPRPRGSSIKFLKTAREAGWRVVATIDSPELPLWVAHDLLDAVVVIDGWSDSPAGAASRRYARQPDKLRYPAPQGVGRWRRALYESLVEAGVRLPPVALSGSGLNTEPIGSSRAYAYVDGERDAWWNATDDLATVVTNGPLLRPMAEGAPPGEVFFLEGDGKRTITITLGLATRTTIEYLEIVKDGRVLHSIRLADLAAAGGKLPEVAFDAPGWLSLVAVAENADRYELAMSAPWFVENDAGGRMSDTARAAWRAALVEARGRFVAADPEAYDEAQEFWESSINP